MSVGDSEQRQHETNGRRRAIKIKLPMGAELEIRGYDFLMVILVAAAALGAYFLYTSKEEHNHLNESLTEMIYILSLSQEDRARLNIAMPPSLRNKVNGH